MDHTGLFHGLAAGSRSAKAVHADCHKQGSGMGSDMQNVANDGFFFNLDSHLLDLLWNSAAIITVCNQKNKREMQNKRLFFLFVFQNVSGLAI